MPNLNFSFGFKFDDSAVKVFNQNLTHVNETVKAFNQSLAHTNETAKVTANLFDGMRDKLKRLGKIQNLASFSTVISNSVSALKSLGAGFENAVGWAGAYADQGDKIAKTSRLVGLSVKDFQALDSAARHAGMGSEEMTAALRKLNVNLFKARSGDATALKPFESLLPKSLSEYKDNAEVIRALAGSYAKLESAEQRAFVSQSLFGEGGLKMSELLSQGEESLKKYIDEYDAAFSEDGARNAEAFNDALQDMRESVNVLKISLAQELFPVFAETFGSVRTFLKSDDGKRKMAGLKSAIVDFVKNILPKIPVALNAVLSVVNAIGPGWSVLIAGIVSVLPALAQVIALLGTLGNVFLSVWANAAKVIFGVVSALREVWTVLRVTFMVVGGTGVASFLLIVGIVVGLVSIVKQFYDNWEMWCSFVNHELTDAVNGFFSDLWDGIKSVGATLYDLFIAPFVNFFKTIPELWESFKDGVGAVAEMFSELGGKIYDAIFGSVRKAWTAAKGFLSGLPFVGGLFESDAPESVASAGASSDLSAHVGEMVRSTNTTTTNRFSVDFRNMPRGVTVTPPASGDFDFSRGYVFGGGF